MTDPSQPDPTAPEHADENTELAGRDDAFARVPEPLAGTLRARGFDALTSVQAAVLGADAQHCDLRISSQTGSGKTVAVGLAIAPLLLGAARPGAAGPDVLVLVPTRELALQVRDELTWLFASAGRMAIEVVIGGTSIVREQRALARRPRVVVGTPGRSLDHIRSQSLVCADVAHVVLDEADRMLDMGFREELEAILETLPETRRTHLVSATFDPAVRRLADRFQARPVHVEGTRLGVANQDIEHAAHIVDRSGAYAATVNYLLLNEERRCLIFVERRVDVTALTERLSADGFPVQALSGELPQAQRTRTLGAFRDGTIRTLVATDVAARGIDVPDIELVIHADLPESADTYVHRSGRTGRAGRTGHSVLLVPPRGERYARRVLQAAGIEADWRPAPTASRVRKSLRRRFRQRLHERLSSDEGPEQNQVDYAKQLLDGRDPTRVVAELLELAQPKPPRAPMDVEDLTTSRPPGARPTGEATGFVTFSINWGARSGAAANRIPGHVCRRGEIRGEQVGAIRIGRDASLFDVDASVADAFEAKARRRDPREPRLRIVRDPNGGAGFVADTGRDAPRESRESRDKRRPGAPWRARGDRRERDQERDQGRGPRRDPGFKKRRP